MKIIENKDKILLLILFIALVLRLWGNWFGFPYLYHQDETHEVLRALELGTGNFSFGRIAKGFYFYLLFFEYGIYFLILKLLGLINTTTDFAQFFLKKTWSFYLIGRTTTALIGALNVYLTYKIGKEAYSNRVGLIAALFLALNYLHAQSSHYITVDVPMAFFATFALLYSIRMVQNGSLKNYILAGIFAGLAVQTKATAIVLVFPILIAHFFVTQAKGFSIRRFFFAKTILIGAIAGAIFLFFGTPGLLLNLKSALIAFRDMFFVSVGQVGTDMSGMDFRPNLFLFYLHALNASAGVPLVFFCLAGIVYASFQRKKEDLILLGYIFLFFLLISMSKLRYLYYYRYIIPILPALMILSARFIEEIAQKLLPERAKLLSTLTVCLLIVQPGYRIILENYFISHKDTRTFAKEWIEENIPAGSRILIEGTRIKPKEDTVPLRYSRKNILEAINRYREKEDGKAKYFELELKALPEVTYDLVTVGYHSDVKDVSSYKKAGIEYIVLRADVHIIKRDWFKGRWKGNFYPTGPDIGEFLEILRKDPEVRLIKSFKPNKWDRPGPSIEIYKILQS
jgi:4-amino-4-deoxy-L-arabinose transferase-like glycosyltransferase